MDASPEHGHERLTDEVNRRLLQLEGEIPPSEIGELWVFPPLEEPEGSREFVLFTRFGDNGTRRLYSARVPPSQEEHRELPGPDGYTREREREMANRRNGDGDADGLDELPDQRITEHGAIPAGRLPGLVQRFRRRLGDDRAPVHLEVDGSRERWLELIEPHSANGDARSNGEVPADGGPAANGDARSNGAGAPSPAGAPTN